MKKSTVTIPRSVRKFLKKKAADEDTTQKELTLKALKKQYPKLKDDINEREGKST